MNKVRPKKKERSIPGPVAAIAEGGLEARRLMDIDPEREAGAALRAAALIHLGQWEDVREVVRPYLSDSDRAALWATTFRALADVEAGNRDMARSQLQEPRRREDNRPVFAIVLIEAALGNEDAALSELQEGGSRRERYFDQILPRSGVVDVRYL